MISIKPANLRAKSALKCIIISLVFSLSSAVGFAVSNPLILDGQVNDCDVLKYNGEYYIMGNWMAGDLLHSQDLRHWLQREHVFSWINTWYVNEYPGNPDLAIHDCHLRYYNGTFHLYCQLGADITHAVSDTVWGPYQELSISGPFSGKIGAEAYMDENGTFHFYPTRFNNGNQIYYRPMQDLWIFEPGSAYSLMISTSESWEGGTQIIEGAKVFKYRGRYYMLYNAYHTVDPRYCFGCVEANSPNTFSNAGKYPYAVLNRKTWPGGGEINTIGQPWVQEGLNGFEKWAGYFAIDNFVFQDNGRRQRIDRIHFFDRKLFIDGPTSPYTSGYHPGPAQPQYRGIFNDPDGPMKPEDWTPVSLGNWFISNKQACQDQQNTFSFTIINRDKARNYLIEANVKFTEARDAEDKCGVLAYYQDSNNWMIVGLDRSLYPGGPVDNWYCHKKENGVDTVVGGGYAGSVNYGVYHKIRVEKNGSTFTIRIDDKIPPSHSGTISTIFSGAGTPGLYTDHAAASFDGVLYTIGWDEYDGYITGWGYSLNGTPPAGSWLTSPSGITQSNQNGEGIIFKGDWMGNYEFSTQVYKEGGESGSVGLYPVYIDSNNYMRVMINFSNNILTASGLNNENSFSQESAIADGTNYNLRTVKLSDKVIIFVNGEEILTANQAFGPSQVALSTNNTAARFNGILLYQTELLDEQAVVACFSLDHDIYDRSGNYIETTIYGTPEFTEEGHIDGAVLFDGNNDYFIIPRIVHYDFSIACWVKTTQTGPVTYSGWWDGAGLIDAGTSGVGADWGLTILNGKAAFGIKDYTIISNTPINDGKWHYVVATRKMSTHQIELYMDGILKASAAAIMTGSKPLTASETITIGMNQTNGSKYYGLMDDIKIHERVLTMAEIMNCVEKNPICSVTRPTDLNNDCTVNLVDLIIISENWLGCGLWPAEKCH